MTVDMQVSTPVRSTSVLTPDGTRVYDYSSIIPTDANNMVTGHYAHIDDTIKCMNFRDHCEAFNLLPPTIWLDDEYSNMEFIVQDIKDRGLHLHVILDGLVTDDHGYHEPPIGTFIRKVLKVVLKDTDLRYVTFYKKGRVHIPEHWTSHCCVSIK